MRVSICLLFVGLLFSALVRSQELPGAPSSHKFWDAGNTALFSLHAGMEVADFAVTHRNLSAGGKEMNPMGKGLCESGTAGQAVFFAGRTAAAMSISYFLHRLRRHRLERMFAAYMIGDSAYGVTYSLSHRHVATPVLSTARRPR